MVHTQKGAAGVAILIVVLAVVVIGGFMLFSQETAEAPDTETEEGVMEEKDGEKMEEKDGTSMLKEGEEGAMEEKDTNTVVYDSSGFSPKTLTVNVGETVTFVNESERSMWVATDAHPTHREYPGSDIQKCGEDQTIFDQCKGNENGEEYSFTFTEEGTWDYHNHLRPGDGGTVVVN